MQTLVFPVMGSVRSQRPLGPAASSPARPPPLPPQAERRLTGVSGVFGGGGGGVSQGGLRQGATSRQSSCSWRASLLLYSAPTGDGRGSAVRDDVAAGAKTRLFSPRLRFLDLGGD